MSHYVVGPDGQRYGPVDAATFGGWVAEGRVLAETTLEEAATGRRLPAGAVPGLRFAPPIPHSAPVGAYPRAGGVAARPQVATPYGRRARSQNVLFSIGAALVAPVLGYLFGYASLLLSVGGLQLAWRAKKDDDHPLWGVALALSTVSLVLTAAFYIRRLL